MSRVARKTRAVSARELSRRMASLLDEMESEEMALIVVRYGRPAAMFVPFEESGDAIKLPRISELDRANEGLEEIGADEADVDLDPDQRYVLLDIERCDEASWHIDRLYRDRSQAGSLLAALTRLELEDLVERRFAGAALTRKGRRVAARLHSAG